MIESVRVEAITSPLTIEIDRSTIEQPDQLREIIETAWQRLCEHNPRYFNGDMLAFTRYNASSGVVSAKIEQYKHHAVRDSVNLGISLLAVTGVLCAQDGNQTKYLIGKRSPATHRYGNLWEFGPCGGVDVPKDADTLNLNSIVKELRRESMEESGLDLNHAHATPLAMVHDDLVGSVDIVLRVDLPGIPKTRPSWEYVDLQWIALDELNQKITFNPEEFIPTTIAIAQLLTNNRDYD